MDRAISILGAFGSGDSALSLAELSRRTGLYKSTALRLLASLEHASLLGRLPDGRFALGPEIGRLNAVFTASFSLQNVALPVLNQLVTQTGESAAFHVMQRKREELVRLCLFRVDSPNPVRDHIKAGDVLPCDRGTGARVLHAFDHELDAHATDEDRCLFQRIRREGYYASVGDRVAEVAGISAPVFDQGGKLVAALTLTMPSHRFDARHVQPVLDAARRMSTAIPD